MEIMCPRTRFTTDMFQPIDTMRASIFQIKVYLSMKHTSCVGSEVEATGSHMLQVRHHVPADMEVGALLSEQSCQKIL